MRIDRGSDFLSSTVAAALGAFAVPVEDLPAYRPELKGTVENLNRCVERMFFASLPGYTRAPSAQLRPGSRSTRGSQAQGAEPLEFTVFVGLLLEWITWWNTEHTSQALEGRTPLQAWQDDPTPVEDVDAHLLWAFTLEDDGRVRTLTACGVRWRSRYYVGEWMTGRADAGTKVRIRYIPHHDHEIEVFDAASGRHLGTAHLADAASADQRRAVRQSREAEKRRLARALSAASRHTRDRFGAVTSAQRPQRLGALTAVQAEQELAVSHRADLAARALPDLIPPSEPPASWARPVKRLAPDPSTPMRRACPTRS
ncbi:Mu transposase C-terminal domain-containing protein (plasmid) [Streptomyces sp. HUAS TT20]|nr:Mu transposase C-terminal domain-containing protein [Streptomyces sp. HUAS 15-9]UXY33152.1 Mu transposase C-terminal domain-containing protein [Streptomyces sp. HUAS 15-9]